MTNYNACLPRLTNSKQTYSMVRMWPPNRMRTSMALWNVGYWNVLGRNWAASFVLDARAMSKSLRWGACFCATMPERLLHTCWESSTPSLLQQRSSLMHQCLGVPICNMPIPCCYHTTYWHTAGLYCVTFTALWTGLAGQQSARMVLEHLQVRR